MMRTPVPAACRRSALHSRSNRTWSATAPAPANRSQSSIQYRCRSLNSSSSPAVDLGLRVGEEPAPGRERRRRTCTASRAGQAGRAAGSATSSDPPRRAIPRIARPRPEPAPRQRGRVEQDAGRPLELDRAPQLGADGRAQDLEDAPGEKGDADDDHHVSQPTGDEALTAGHRAARPPHAGQHTLAQPVARELPVGEDETAARTRTPPIESRSTVLGCRAKSASIWSVASTKARAAPTNT